MQEVYYRALHVKEEMRRKYDGIGKVFRPQCASDTCEKKESRKQDWTERASHNDLDLIKCQPTQ